MTVKLTDVSLASALTSNKKVLVIRSGANLREQMIEVESGLNTFECPEHFKLLTSINSWMHQSKEKIGNI